MPPQRPKQPRPIPGGVEYDHPQVPGTQRGREADMPAQQQPSMPVPWTDQRPIPPGAPTPVKP